MNQGIILILLFGVLSFSALGQCDIINIFAQDSSGIEFGDLRDEPVYFDEGILWLDELNGLDRILYYNFDSIEVLTNRTIFQDVSIHTFATDGNAVILSDAQSIYRFDNSEIMRIPVNDDSSLSLISNLSIDGEYIGWTAHQGYSSRQVFLYDGRTTKDISTPFIGLSRTTHQVQIDGDHLIWQNFPYQIWRYDIQNEMAIELTSLLPLSTEDPVFATIIGEKVVWRTFYNGEHRIFLYENGEVIIISDNDIDTQFGVGDAKTSLEYIAWLTYDDVQSKIMVFNDEGIIPVTLPNNIMDWIFVDFVISDDAILVNDILEGSVYYYNFHDWSKLNLEKQIPYSTIISSQLIGEKVLITTDDDMFVSRCALPAEPKPIPTMSEWLIICLMELLLILSVLSINSYSFKSKFNS